jgi:hypothetical protein
MVQAGIKSAPISSFEEDIRAELARGDLAIGSTAPVMRTLLSNSDPLLFSNEIVARVRGMLSHLARQLLAVQAEEAGAADPLAIPRSQANDLTAILAADSGLLRHVHALALECQLIERLQVQNGLDGALTPLLQAQVASPDASTAETAMATLAAQVRFLQHSRRMELPLEELPADLFHVALQALAAPTEPESAGRALARLRGGYDEGRSRRALISRLVTGLGTTSAAALSVDHAGIAIFLSALALASGQDRDIVVFSTSGSQVARLALALRAAGLKRQEAARQFLFFHPELALPEEFEALGAHAAAGMLVSADPFAGE